ncbi:PI-PLC domain-containing protein [Pengzhenrongella sicca]|uniref:Uncharacterized protein n=1 Tax=Pengzhenrongella sicca TaxID=2819238 RepID=A0A8A4ZAI7_9MICO|nr:hypothetical protein [Pengzhenrongella sicca]QTE28980.1 hypothetical protein J4E96_16960 [Pengzhenrongella sicca]
MPAPAPLHAHARRRAAAALLALAAVLVALAGVAGLINRQVLDEAAFVANVESLRQDPAVAQAAGERVADAAIERRPNLVAVRPLVADLSARVVASDAAAPLFKLAARQAHAALTTPGSAQVALRLADAGAVVTTALRTISPEAAAAIPADLPVTLASIGGQGGALDVGLGFARAAGTLAWLLPLAAGVALVLGAALHPSRRRGLLDAAIAVLVGGALLLGAAVATSIWSARADPATLGGATAAALWAGVGGQLVRAAALTLLLGGLLAAATTIAGAGWPSWRPRSPRGAAARGVGAGAVGIALIGWPELAVRTLATLAGVAAVLYAVRTLARAVARARPRSVVPVALLLTAAAVVGALLALGARPAGPPAAGPDAAATPAPVGCNGHAKLCDRRYDEVAFAGAHNAMSALDEGFYLAEQPTGLAGQLDLGVRVLLIDTWYGIPLTGGAVSTDPSQFADAAARARDAFGPDVAASAERIVARVQATGGQPTGPAAPYLCHSFCELGATELVPALRDVADWMQRHPREVVTLFIQDVVTPADTAAALADAGLAAAVYVPASAGSPWPTLGAMLDSGERLVVLMENRAGGAEFPGLLPGFEYAQDTPYAYESTAAFDCAPNRGPADAPLLLVNHWLSGFTRLYTDAQAANAYDVLTARVRECVAVRGRPPSFLAVNWADVGDLSRVVDETNGL